LLNYLEEKIWQELNKTIQLLCEHKADAKHTICGAASILAKVTRDEEIEKLKRKIGVDFGSGYPSDPVTRKFLEDYGKKHKKDGIFRETWVTWKNHIARKEQLKLDGFS
jgi:ribonuclease HII